MINAIRESIKEMTYQVTWPTYKELSQLSTLFLIGLFVTTSFVGLMNISLQKISTWLYASF